MQGICQSARVTRLPTHSSRSGVVPTCREAQGGGSEVGLANVEPSKRQLPPGLSAAPHSPSDPPELHTQALGTSGIRW
ncbi:hypothetical protein GN956_G7735 [Arapaima gigas]